MLNKVQRMHQKPPYAPFPRSEYAHRIRRVKEEMEAAQLDVIVMWDESIEAAMRSVPEVS